jgi:adenosylcobinamide-GDP ribazoletransferase
VQKLAAAFKYLTLWGRFTGFQPPPIMIGAAMIYFPAVGLVLGLLLALLNYLLAPYLPPEILSMVLITTLIVLTGGTHLEGVKHTFDDAPTKSSLTETNQNNTLGFTAIVMVVLFKAAATDSMDEKLALSLLLAPVLARWGLLIFAYGYHDRCEETSRLIAEQVKFWHLAVATLGTLALTVYYLGRRGLWIALSLSLLALTTRSLIHRFRANLTHHNFGAIIELGETLSLVLLASL